MDIKQSIIAWAEAHEREYLADLKELIAIDSARADALPGMPYGKNCADVLAKAQEILAKHGFASVNHDNYVITADLNEGETELGVLAHLDIVPTGDGWQRPPLDMQEDETKIYGRGTADDKGPALAAFYAMRALKELNVPKGILPEVCPSSGLFGYTDPEWFGGPIPMAGAAGDQQAALFGQACFHPGEAKNTYGTGCFTLMNIGTDIKYSKNGLVTTIAWGLDGKVEYAFEGSVFVAGASIQWLRDEMGLVENAPASEKYASLVPDTNGCYVVPAFTGLGAPYWDQYARGCIVGLTRGVNRNHVIRATLESLAYQSADLLFAMEKDSGIQLEALKVDGGASANNFIMQFQSDIIGTPVLRPKCVETTAMGAAYLAGLAVGYWKSKEDVVKNWAIDRTFTPQMGDIERDQRLTGWHRAVKCAFGWARDDR